MKKIINSLILIIICFIPVMVNAKANAEIEWSLKDKYYLYGEDDKYYFLDSYYSGSYSADYVNLLTYGKDGKLINEELFFDTSKYTEEEFKQTKRYQVFFNKYMDYKVYNELDGKNYNIDYMGENFFYFNGEEVVEIFFSEDVDLTRKLLGKRYDVFQKIKSNGYSVETIKTLDNLYCAYGYTYDEETNKTIYHVYLLDDNLNIVFSTSLETEFYVLAAYLYDGLIYFASDNDVIDIYKLDGTKVDSITFEDSIINNSEKEICGTLMPSDIVVKDNELLVAYEAYGCNGRLEVNDANDLGTYFEHVERYFIKFKLKYDVETVESDYGKFTYDEVLDEDGKSYVELKIDPKDGYSVEEIIVTDINGIKIEVTDNRFYKPMNDVKIEIKYTNGEYLPIPDTFLGKSITLSIIGLILVGLGIYTFNYVRKVD